MRKTLGVVLARGGSKGVPRKNLVPLLGKPLMAYTIEHALQSGRLTRLVLSTDDVEIAAVGESMGVRVIVRPEEMATDTEPMDWALRQAVRVIEEESGRIEFVVALYGCVPVRKIGIIDEVIEKLESSGADSVETYAVYRTPPQWSFAIEGDRPRPLEGCHKEEYRRQNLAKAYYQDGAVVAMKRDVLMRTEGIPTGSDDFLGTDRRVVIQDPNDTVNVDEPSDVLWAEFLLAREKEARTALGVNS
jgi:CMP-N,N'-diacetyllegionaminic acid synthase